MASHKYEVGQDVRLRPNRMSLWSGLRNAKSCANCRLKGAPTFIGSSASLKRASASPKKATSPCEISIGAGTLPAIGEHCQMRKQPDELCADALYVATRDRAF